MPINTQSTNSEPPSTAFGEIVRLVTPTTPIPVSGAGAGGGTSTAPTQTYPAYNAASQTLLAANTARRGFVIVNETDRNLKVKFGATASASSYTYLLAPNATLELFGVYLGIIDAIGAAGGTGNISVSEFN